MNFQRKDSGGKFFFAFSKRLDTAVYALIKVKESCMTLGPFFQKFLSISISDVILILFNASDVVNFSWYLLSKLKLIWFIF